MSEPTLKSLDNKISKIQSSLDDIQNNGNIKATPNGKKLPQLIKIIREIEENLSNKICYKNAVCGGGRKKRTRKRRKSRRKSRRRKRRRKKRTKRRR